MATVRRMPQDRQRPKARKGVFDIDALERDGSPELFVATVGGKEFTFHDPSESDWQDYSGIDMSNPEESLKLLLGDQYEAFKKIRLPLWKLNKLAEAVENHYAKFYGNQGEDNASSTS